MADSADQQLDAYAGNGEARTSGKRRWLGIHFECCDVYSRIYKNKSGTTYVGFCPKCARKVRVPVGPDGTDSRFFSAH